MPDRRRRGRIFLSLLGLLFLVGVVPLLWTSWYLVSQARTDLEVDQRTLQLSKAKGLAQQVAIYNRSLHNEIAAIARTLELDPAASFAARLDRVRAQRALERYVGPDSKFLYMTLVDAEGGGPSSGFAFREDAVEELLAEGWRRGMQGTRMVSHPLVSTSLEGEPVVVLAEPVRSDPQRPPQGVLLAVASLGPVWTMTGETGEAGLIEAYVVDVRGRVVAHSDPGKVSAGSDFSDVEIVKQFLETRGRAAATAPFRLQAEDGRVLQMLGTYQGLGDDSGWGVIVQVDEEKAYYSAIQMRRNAAIVVGIVVLLGAGLGGAVSGQITQPIRELARGALQLAQGDYATRVRVRSGNEVGTLADAFNQMGEEIQKAIAQIREAAEVNKELFMGSIRMLANAIDEKDPYTRGHSERVAFYSAITAKYMGMPPDEVERVHLSGIIHDVGKIGIEDKILRKPAALTDEEFEIMKQHPTKGLHILEAVPRLKEIAGAGLMHHENYDGSGYPEGLKGEDIPLLGRIVSVADAFDAMTTDRPYSKAMTFEAAVARLRFLAGKKFDDTCVTAFEAAFAAGELTPAKARLAAVAARKAMAPSAAN
ncbi:MAG: HD domain-containing protein [Vicinamibacteria bacterium]|nr:HD domain-containing protein [Vicinamibacteria bacterium]